MTHTHTPNWPTDTEVDHKLGPAGRPVHARARARESERGHVVNVNAHFTQKRCGRDERTRAVIMIIDAEDALVVAFFMCVCGNNEIIFIK